MNRTRFYYLDLLRVFLTMLVFYHHSAVAFGASGGWYYISKETTTGLTQGLLSASMGIDQSYFMSLFFFISAYLMPFSFDRKGMKSFIYDPVISRNHLILSYCCSALISVYLGASIISTNALSTGPSPIGSFFHWGRL